MIEERPEEEEKKPAGTHRPFKVEECISCEGREYTMNDLEDIVECACCGGAGAAAICPGCDGAGNIRQHATKREAELAHQPLYRPCEVCRGRGQLKLSRELVEKLPKKPPASFQWVDGQLKVM